MPMNVSYCMGVHQPEPFTVAEYGDDGVCSIKDGIEYQAFICIQPDAYDVHYEPCQPLLGVFASHHPCGYD